MFWEFGIISLEPNFSEKRKSLRFENLRLGILAEWTGLEPATPGVTGRYSNQLNYHSIRLSVRSRCRRSRNST